MHFLKTEKRRLVGEGRKRNGWMSKLEWQGGGGRGYRRELDSFSTPYKLTDQYITNIYS